MARPATDLRLRVLGAARAAFDERGFEGTSLREIARAAGTTIGMIYYYFPTKDALWDAVIDETYQRFLHDVTGILGRPGTLRDRLRAMASYIGALGDEQRTVIRLALRDALHSSERRARLFARFARGHIPLVMKAVMEAQASGELVRAPTPMVMFHAGMAIVGGQLLLGNIPLPGLPVGEARIEAALDLLFDGIGAPTEEPPPPRPKKRP